MRVLLLRRTSQGGMAALSDALPPALAEFGVEADVVDAEEWMPKATGRKVDPGVTKRLRALAKPYDLVHAFGYRTAWACGEAFGMRRPWLYTAYDLPKTTHPELIDRLLPARIGLCSSTAVLRALRAADATGLRVLVPGAPPAAAGAKTPSDHPRILAAGRFVAERGFDALLGAMPQVWECEPHATLTLVGDGPLASELGRQAEALGERVRFVPRYEPLAARLADADLAVVPSRSAGFSLFAAEAMLAGVPVLMRDAGGLGEMVDEGITGWVFFTDDEMAGRLAGLAGAPDVWAFVSAQAQKAAEERFSLRRCAEQYAGAYADCA